MFFGNRCFFNFRSSTCGNSNWRCHEVTSRDEHHHDDNHEELCESVCSSNCHGRRFNRFFNRNSFHNFNNLCRHCNACHSQDHDHDHDHDNDHRHKNQCESCDTEEINECEPCEGFHCKGTRCGCQEETPVVYSIGTIYIDTCLANCPGCPDRCRVEEVVYSYEN